MERSTCKYPVSTEDAALDVACHWWEHSSLTEDTKELQILEVTEILGKEHLRSEVRRLLDVMQFSAEDISKDLQGPSTQLPNPAGKSTFLDVVLYRNFIAINDRSLSDLGRIMSNICVNQTFFS